MDARRTQLLIVGDVHGCLDDLNALLRKAKFDPKRHQLVFVGDIVTKGPASNAVVERIRELGGVSVLGNNDNKALQCIDGTVPLEFRATAGPVCADAQTLTPASVQYLRSLPLYLRVPALDLIVVHAGVAPGRRPATTSPSLLMNMRSTDETGEALIDYVEDRPWAASWAGPETVVFGHDARREFQQFSFAVGLDTAAVYGGRLTALRWRSGSSAATRGDLDLVSVPHKTAG